ncbi:hypothetical protein BFN03_01025 [Rhodococcus sp. WMMA185]|uniref:SRPBCC domain-containing protein n=1 Tax=Rhodococcus sp. WMMA185 TaxID=679318 RepID=UPI0008782154|nr:SRPBCC domain-containing protein [Rhodococcus sp. WMMA185]AOW94232.1 hypothetical protein BFN03_01025 [Rhodococcus sp. WMMA185]
MALSLLGRKNVHAELMIPAPAEAIWSVLTDAEGYQDWNPVFTSVTGEYRPGAKMAYLMRDKSGNETDVTASVAKLDEARELNQFGGIRGILTFDHHWLLEPVEGGIRVTQHEEYRGIGVWFWDPSWFKTAYERANEALRDRVLGNVEEETAP